MGGPPRPLYFLSHGQSFIFLAWTLGPWIFLRKSDKDTGQNSCLWPAGPENESLERTGLGTVVANVSPHPGGTDPSLGLLGWSYPMMAPECLIPTSSPGQLVDGQVTSALPDPGPRSPSQVPTPSPHSAYLSIFATCASAMSVYLKHSRFYFVMKANEG